MEALPFLALPLPFCQRLTPLRAVLQGAFSALLERVKAAEKAHDGGADFDPALHRLLQGLQVRRCPRCATQIEKNSGCSESECNCPAGPRAILSVMTEKRLETMQRASSCTAACRSSGHRKLGTVGLRVHALLCAAVDCYLCGQHFEWKDALKLLKPPGRHARASRWGGGRGAAFPCASAAILPKTDASTCGAAGPPPPPPPP